MPQPARGVFVDRAFDRKRFHQPDRTERQSDAMLQHAALEKIHFQAAAAQIENQTRPDCAAQRPTDGRANQPCFFLAANYFEFDPGFAPDAFSQPPVVAGLARRGCRHRAIGAHVMMVHAIAEMAERADRPRNRIRIEHSPGKRVVPQTHRGAFAFKDGNVLRRGGAPNRQADGVRSGVNRG